MAEGAVGPLEAIFKTLDFKPLIFGTFAEASTNVGEFMDCGARSGIRSGAPWANNGGDIGGLHQNGVEMEVQDSAGNGIVEGIREPGPRQDEVRGDGDRKGEESPD